MFDFGSYWFGFYLSIVQVIQEKKRNGQMKRYKESRLLLGFAGISLAKKETSPE